MKVCFFIGLGGTGKEVLESYLKIRSDFVKDAHESSREEYFYIDVASPSAVMQNPIWRDEVDGEVPVKRYHHLQGFQNGRRTVSQLKEMNGDSTNVQEVFPETDEVIDDEGNVDGSWYRRKIGFLSLFNQLSRDPRLFSDIIKKSKYYSNLRDPDEQLTIFFIFINSLAGGTGSGLFLPFAAMLKKKMEEEFHTDEARVFARYVLIAMLPEVLAKGGRKDTDEKRKRYRANTYIALNEIDFLDNADTEKDWNVVFKRDFQFRYRKGMSIFDAVYLIGDANTAGKTLSIEDYNPYFQMAGWFLFIIARQSEEFLADFGQQLAGFGSVGVSVAEFPEGDLLRYHRDSLLGSIGNTFAPGRLENTDLVQQGALAFGLERNFNDLRAQINRGILDLEYELSNRLRQYKGPADIERIKTEPFLGKDYGPWIQEKERFLIEELNRSVEDYLRQQWTLKNISGFISKLNDLNEVYLNGLSAEVEERDEKLKRIKGDLDHARKPKGLKELKIEYELLNQIVQNSHKIRDLVNRVKNHLQIRRLFLESMNDLVIKVLPPLWAKQVEPRFKYEPSTYVWDLKSYDSLSKMASMKQEALFLKKGADREKGQAALIEEIMQVYYMGIADQALFIYQQCFPSYSSNMFSEKTIEKAKDDFKKKLYGAVLAELEKNKLYERERDVSNYEASFSRQLMEKGEPFLNPKLPARQNIRKYAIAAQGILHKLPPQFNEHQSFAFDVPESLFINMNVISNLSYADLEPYIMNYRAAFEELKKDGDNAHCFLDHRLKIEEFIAARGNPGGKQGA